MKLAGGESFQHQLAEGPGLWLQLIRGQVRAGLDQLSPGDAVCTEIPRILDFQAGDQPVVPLLFDLA